MIGLFSDAGARLPIVYNGYTFNANNLTGEEAVAVERVISRTALVAVQDQRNDDRDGSEIYRPRKPARVIRLEGEVRSASPTLFYDQLVAMTLACDPVLVRRANPTTEGFIPLTFTTPRAAGNLSCQYYARPREVPEPELSALVGANQALFVVEFLLRDPRRYLQTASSLTGAGTATNSGNYPTWPTVTITMAGAGSATYAVDITGDSGTPLVLNLSARVNTDVVVVNMESRTITLNAVETPSLYVSGDYFDLSAGANTVALTNTTNATTVTSWRSAFAT